MTISKIKLSLAGALVATVALTPIIIQHRSPERALAQTADLQQRLAAERLRQADASVASSNYDELARLRREHRELLRLRGEVGLLRKESQELARLRAEWQNSRAPEDRRPPYRSADSWANQGTASPEAALETFFWAAKQKDSDLVAQLIRWRKDDSIPEFEGLAKLMEPLVPAATRLISELAGIRFLAQKEDGENTRRFRVEFTSAAGKVEQKELQMVNEDGQWMPLFHAWSPQEGSMQAALDVPLSPDLSPTN